MKRFAKVFVFVLDGLGVGEAPDASAFGDQGADTLGHVLSSRPVAIPHLLSLGLGNLPPSFEGGRRSQTLGAFGKMAEKSAGKDTATGHWEMAGLVTVKPFRTFPQGFPRELVEPFEARIGRKVLGNRAESGTEILKELGEEHVRTGRPILYTSADSVFQLAAHESVIPPADLYAMCHVAYEIACLQFGVCRVIARPFVGEKASDFRRTANRRDFPVPPGGRTVLDALSEAGIPVHGIGKIGDIFTGRGLASDVHTRSDSDGIDKALATWKGFKRGMVFVNLVDFDTLYGHRNDVEGYAKNLEAFDGRIPEILDSLGEEGLFLLTGDHGCDPSDKSTDHTREFVPVLAAGTGVQGDTNLGTRESFADLGATVAENFGLSPVAGRSFLGTMTEAPPRSSSQTL